MKILVTGCAGAIGSHLAERLMVEGHQVVGIDALTPYYNREIKKINAVDLEDKGIRIYYLDLAKDGLEEAMEGVEAVFHCAAQPGISVTTPFQDYLDNNIVATYNMLEASKKLPNLKVFVFLSTSSVYGAIANGDEETVPKPTSWYGATKLSAEQLVLSYFRDKNFPAISARLFSVYGERERPEKLFHKLTKAMCEEAEFPLFEGSDKHIRSYTYVGDIVEGLILILKNFERCLGEIINLGNDTTNTTGEGIKIIEEIFGRKANLKIIPRRAGDQLETAANIGKAKRLLGYNPEVNLREGLEAEVKWYKEKIFGKIK